MKCEYPSINQRVIDENKKVISIEEAETNKQYTCIQCGMPVGVRNPTNKRKHFFHIPTEKNHDNQLNEGILHKLAKNEVKKIFEKHFPETEFSIEKHIQEINARADIFGIINGTPIAIEIQHSSITPEEIVRRTKKYSEAGIYTLWITPYRTFFEAVKKRKKLFERFFQKMYQDTFYLWTEDGGIKKGHVYTKYNGKIGNTFIKNADIEDISFFQTKKQKLGRIRFKDLKLVSLNSDKDWWKQEKEISAGTIFYTFIILITIILYCFISC